MKRGAEMSIREKLIACSDAKNADFVRKLVPPKPLSAFLGCRTPALRQISKEIAGTDEAEAFLKQLPHALFDENQLHAFLLCCEKDFSRCVERVCAFLPYVDNWATCDQLSPAVFRREKQNLLPYIREWIRSDHLYTVRFAVGMLMQHFLDDAFSPDYPEIVASIRSEEYYINMEIAWYFATALAKQPEAILPYFTEHRLSEWTHRKAIQKCVESRRIPQETKDYLRTLR